MRHAPRSISKKVTHALESAFILSGVTARWPRRSHEAVRISGWAGQAGPEIRPAAPGAGSGQPQPAGGAPGGAAVRWRGLASLQITARARLGTDLANPSLQGAYPVPIARGGARGLASPWRFPALHFPLPRERKTGQGNPRPLRTGGGAL